jgi:hypothetical protein
MSGAHQLDDSPRKFVGQVCVTPAEHGGILFVPLREILRDLVRLGAVQDSVFQAAQCAWFGLRNANVEVVVYARPRR